MRRTHSPLLIAMLLAGCLGAADEADPDLGAAEAELARARDRLGPLPGERIAARGAFSCDFTLDFTAFTEPVGPVITRDRVLMQRFALEETNPDEPGMLQKHIPFFATSETTALAGGRYLFQGRRQAAQYERFVTERFEYPAGTQFLDRPEFRDPECRDWTVLSARRFSGLDTHTVLRTERFDTGLTRCQQSPQGGPASTGSTGPVSAGGGERGSRGPSASGYTGPASSPPPPASSSLRRPSAGRTCTPRDGSRRRRTPARRWRRSSTCTAVTRPGCTPGPARRGQRSRGARRRGRG